MANRQITGRGGKAASRVQEGMGRLFLSNKLNNWAGALIGLFIATSMGFLVATSPAIGFGVLGLVLGLAVIIACLANPSTGFYMNMVYSMFIYQVNRMFFHDELQVGLAIDVLGFTILFGFFIKGVSVKTSFNEFIRAPVAILIVLNFLYGILEIFNPEGHSVVAWVMAVRKAFETFIFLFVIYMILKDRESVKQYIRWLFALCVLVALYGCIQQWHGLFDFERDWVFADDIRRGIFYINGEFRKFSTFNDPAAFGEMMAAVSVFFAILALNQPDKRTRRTLFGGVILMVLAMVYSGTRTANVMLLSGLVLYILLTLDRKSSRRLAMVVAVFLLGVLYVPIYGNNSLNRFRSSFVGSNDESYNVRVTARNYIRPYMLSHPFGGGLMTTNNIGLTMNPGHYLAGFQTDSGYLQLALEIGWVGLTLICVMFYMILRTGVRCYFQSGNAEMKPVYAAGTCALFTYYVGMFAQTTVGSMADMAFYYPLIAIFLRFKYFENPDPISARNGMMVK